MAEFTYEQMVRDAIRTTANLHRHLRDFGMPGVLNIGSTSYFDNELKWLAESTSQIENPKFAIGTHSHSPGAEKRYRGEIARILSRLQAAIVMAQVEWKANMMRMEQETATYSAELADERTTLIREEDEAKEKILGYHRNQLTSIGLRTPGKIRFFTESCPYNEGVVIVFANGRITGAAYSESLQLYVKNLRDNLGEGYNVAYFATDALGEIEGEWLQTRIKKMGTKTKS